MLLPLVYMYWLTAAADAATKSTGADATNGGAGLTSAPPPTRVCLKMTLEILHGLKSTLTEKHTCIA